MSPYILGHFKKIISLITSSILFCLFCLSGTPIVQMLGSLILILLSSCIFIFCFPSLPFSYFLVYFFKFISQFSTEAFFCSHVSFMISKNFLYFYLFYMWMIIYVLYIFYILFVSFFFFTSWKILVIVLNFLDNLYAFQVAFFCLFVFVSNTLISLFPEVCWYLAFSLYLKCEYFKKAVAKLYCMNRACMLHCGVTWLRWDFHCGTLDVSLVFIFLLLFSF